MNILDFIKKIIFPPRCVFCDRIMEPNTISEVCGKCSEDIDFCSSHECCQKCGKPIVSYGEKQWCYFCLNEKTQYYDRIASVFTYEGIVRESILRYKFSIIQGYASIYAECMAARYFEEFEELPIDCICAVPSHADKRAEFGFDQVEMMCSELAKIINISFKTGILKKTRKTKRQSLLSYAERRKNLEGSIAVALVDEVCGKSVLLVDDICTTRATITECAKVLKRAGAKRVYAITLATTMK